MVNYNTTPLMRPTTALLLPFSCPSLISLPSTLPLLASNAVMVVNSLIMWQNGVSTCQVPYPMSLPNLRQMSWTCRVKYDQIHTTLGLWRYTLVFSGIYDDIAHGWDASAGSTSDLHSELAGPRRFYVDRQVHGATISNCNESTAPTTFLLPPFSLLLGITIDQMGSWFTGRTICYGMLSKKSLQ